MALLEIDRNPSSDKVQHFALVWLPAFLLLLAGLRWYRSGPVPGVAGLTLGALAAMVCGLVWPGLMRMVMLGWSYVTYPIGWTVSHLVLGFAFYVVFTPVGLLTRLFRDPLGRRFDRKQPSYWVRRQESPRPDRYFQQF
jgi:hypothetical protein